MGKRELGSVLDRPQLDLETGHKTGFVRFSAVDPLPAHDNALLRNDLEIFAGTLVFAAVECPETHAVAAARTRIGFGEQYRARVGSPPARNAFRGYQCLEDDGRSCLDPADEREACHRFLLVSVSFRSA